jgi:hypothetical protein
MILYAGYVSQDRVCCSGRLVSSRIVFTVACERQRQQRYIDTDIPINLYTTTGHGQLVPLALESIFSLCVDRESRVCAADLIRTDASDGHSEVQHKCFARNILARYLQCSCAQGKRCKGSLWPQVHLLANSYTVVFPKKAK